MKTTLRLRTVVIEQCRNVSVALTLSIMLLTPLLFLGEGLGVRCFAQVANGTGAGNCLSFDGVSNWVNVPGITWTPTSYSVEWWLYPTANWNYNQVLGNGWGTFLFHTTSDGSVYVGTDVPTRFTPTNLPANTVEINKWQHFAFTFDNGNAKFYKNGVLLASKTGMTNPTAWIGGFIVGVPWSGTIKGSADEVRIWNRALTETEIRDNMCKKLTGSESGLVGYWRFDEGSGSTVYDATTNGNNGTLY